MEIIIPPIISIGQCINDNQLNKATQRDKINKKNAN